MTITYEEYKAQMKELRAQRKGIWGHTKDFVRGTYETARDTAKGTFKFAANTLVTGFDIASTINKAQAYTQTVENTSDYHAKQGYAFAEQVAEAVEQGKMKKKKIRELEKKLLENLGVFSQLNFQYQTA
jgi:hypothetical protein